MWPPIAMLGTLNVNTRLMIDEEADLRGELVEAAVAGDQERRRHQPEDPARGADGELVRVEQQGPERAAEHRDDVDADEARGPDRRLEQGAEDVEGEHVEPEVDEPGVQERRGDEPVRLAAGDPIAAPNEPPSAIRPSAAVERAAAAADPPLAISATKASTQSAMIA